MQKNNSSKVNLKSLDYTLSQNYPNPFNPSTKIKYSIPVNSYVEIKVFDMFGSDVANLFTGNKEAGIYEVQFNTKDISSGTYFYKIQAGNYTETKKLIILK